MELKNKLKNKVISESNSKLEFKQRLQPNIISILNSQIANELQSSQIYRGMACYLDNIGWSNASKYFMKSADEELEHMRKVYNYLFDKNCKAVVPCCKDVQQEFADIRDVLTKSLEHEIVVTSNWENIAKLACDSNDKTTMFFSQWFINEQVEEESKIRELLYLLNLDAPKWKMEEEFKELLG